VQGFAFTAEDDLAFALGYPHFRVILDGHPDDANAADVAKSMMLAVWPLTETRELPREVALRVARGLSSDRVWLHNWTPAADEVIARSESIDIDEAPEMTARLLRSEAPLNGPQHVALILEAFHGPEVVADLIVTEMETLEAAPRFAHFFLYQVGFMLLRALPATVLVLRERMEVVFRRWAKASGLPVPLPEALRVSPAGFEYSLRGLDVMLHGAEEALAWLRSHIEYARPIVADLEASQGPLAMSARDLSSAIAETDEA
jgi:hypothetical protein